MSFSVWFISLSIIPSRSSWDFFYTSRIWSNLVNVVCTWEEWVFIVHLRRMSIHSALVQWHVLEMSIRSIWLIELFKLSISLLILCQLIWLVIEKGVFNSLIIIVDYFFLQFCQFCSMYFEDLLLVAFTFRIMFSWVINLIIMK